VGCWLKERDTDPATFEAGADATVEPDEPELPVELPESLLSLAGGEVGTGVSVGALPDGHERVTL
jgi:hypothetical protein